MDPILEFARQNSLWVIEDCAQAHGATYKGRRVGSIGDVATFSFCQDKILSTAGEGGMVLTNDAILWERMWSYKDHGRDYLLSHAPAGSGFRWIHNTFGTNFRLTEIQSAIGRLQLRKLDEQLATRRRNATAIAETLRDVPGLRLTVPPASVGHAYYRYYVFVEPDALRPDWDRDRVLGAICAEGIPCSQGSCSEVYLEQAFPLDIRPVHPIETARRLGKTSLAFMVHPTLSEEDVQDTCRAIRKVMSVAAPAGVRAAA
jgi:dTDP-4-amino-4,6-dideoxygalactose transaminase